MRRGVSARPGASGSAPRARRRSAAARRAAAMSIVRSSGPAAGAASVRFMPAFATDMARFLPVRMAAMRLLYVLERFPVLSETFVVDELRGLLRAGDEVTVYARARVETGVADDL